MSELGNAVRKLVRKLVPIDYFAAYECKVTAVNADGTVDLDPFDPRLKPGPQYVEIAAPAGYQRIRPKVGAICMMSFKNGLPNAPFIEYFRLGDSFSEVAISADKITLNGGSAAVARQGDTIGTLSATSTPGGGAVNFTYTPPDGPPLTGPTVQLHIAAGNRTILG